MSSYQNTVDPCSVIPISTKVKATIPLMDGTSVAKIMAKPQNGATFDPRAVGALNQPRQSKFNGLTGNHLAI